MVSIDLTIIRIENLLDPTTTFRRCGFQFTPRDILPRNTIYLRDAFNRIPRLVIDNHRAHFAKLFTPYKIKGAAGNLPRLSSTPKSPPVFH